MKLTVRALRAAAELGDRDIPDDAVRTGTMHRLKGLEFRSCVPRNSARLEILAG